MQFRVVEAHVLQKMRDDLLASRAEVGCLRVELYEAQAMLDAVEDELRSVTGSWSGSMEMITSRSAARLLIRARTLMRRALFQKLVTEDDKDAALHELKVAEANFHFIINLTSIRTQNTCDNL